MFVVYSPEGQSFIGAVQNIPVLKVDPSKRVMQSKEAGLEDMKMEPDHSSAYFQQGQALKKYQGVKHLNERKLVVKAHEIMSSPVITIGSGANLHQAWALMKEHSIDHLPVVNEQALLGIFSKSDLLNRVILNQQGEIEEVRSASVAEIMSQQVIATQADTDIREVAQALTEFDIGALPIMTTNEELVGIVTLSDLVKRLSQQPPLELYI